MSYAYWARPYISIANTATFFAGNGGTFAGLWSLLSSAGWTLHDTQSGYRVYYSNGENGDACPWYLHIATSLVSGYCTVTLYRYWNNSTQTGTGAASNTGRFYLSESGFNAYIYVNKDMLFLVTVIGSNFYTFMSGQVVTYLSEVPRTTTTAGVSAGSNVTISITSSSDDYEIGGTYQILDNASASTEFFTCNGKGANTVQAASLSNNYASGSWVGKSARDVFIKATNTNALNFVEYTGASGDSAGSRILTNLDSCVFTEEMMTMASALQRAKSINLVLARMPDTTIPVSLSYNILLGAVSPAFRFVIANGTVSETYCFFCIVVSDTLSSGTSTGSNSSTTLNDTGKSWTTNEFADKYLYISNGTGQGQFRKILSNTATELTITVAWDVTPDASSDYVVTTSAKRVVPMKNSTVTSSTPQACFFLTETGE